MWPAWRLPLQNIELMTQYGELGFQLLSRLKQSHSIRTNRRPIAIIWRSCSDSPVTAGQRMRFRKRQARTHLSLDKDCPQPRRVQPASAGNIIAFPEVGGLHHRYERRAA